MKKTIILLSLITAFASGAAAGSAETEKLIKSDAQLRAMKSFWICPMGIVKIGDTKGIESF